MVYAELFLTFLKIGALSFGGGYGMISIIRDETLAHGWLTEEALADFIAVSESTPGPLAVNMATFIGSSQAGVWGALLATIGVVLPAFVIILAIAAILKNILKYAGVKAVLGGIRPAVAGLITATAAVMFLGYAAGIKTVNSTFLPDYKFLIILGILGGLWLIFRLVFKKSPPPVPLIIISGILGVIFYFPR